MSVLFADLSAFTTFSERHAATEVIAMLNDYWAAVVPGIDAAGGEIEQFVGDAVMAAFNVEGDQPDHAQRAARAALAIIEGGPGRPRGTSRLARVPGRRQHRPRGGRQRGDRGRRSFAVIGDTTNTAARLMSVAAPGEVLVTGRHVAAAGRGLARRAAGSGRRSRVAASQSRSGASLPCIAGWGYSSRRWVASSELRASGSSASARHAGDAGRRPRPERRGPGAVPERGAFPDHRAGPDLGDLLARRPRRRTSRRG